MDLLKIECETNPTIAGYVEAKRSKGDQKDVDMAVETAMRTATTEETLPVRERSSVYSPFT
jgi:hypothetical protein